MSQNTTDETPRPVRKAVIPAAGLGTRFLPFSKAVPKEMLPVVDRPVIQYVIEEAVDAGIGDILVVTSRHKKVLEDHFDRIQELEDQLVAKGKTDEADEIRALSDLAQLHFVRQGEALGLGHAIGVARNHVGAEPFVVLLGDDIMAPEVGVLRGMIEAYNEHHCSIVALMEVPKEDISAYGCAAATPLDDHLVRISELIEKPAPEEAPSNLAVMGRYLFTPTIFEEIARTPPGVGGEIQITDAMATLLEREPMLGFTFSEGRFDTGKKIDYLRAVVETALARPDLGPEFRAVLADIVAREGLAEL
jgi:UTP--glucose-1-phosphate uridylyltransferase